MTSHVLQDLSETITNNYSHNHQAIDVVATGNKVDDVIAAGDGTVEMVVKNIKYTDHNSKGTATYGNFVKLKHPSGKKTLYAHMEYGSVTVKQGQAVSKGEKIGTMGATGNAYGKHLHFEVRNADETRENPNKLLNGEIDLGENKKQEEIKQEVKEEIKEEEEITDKLNTEVPEQTEDNYQNETPADNEKKVNTSSEIINNLPPAKIKTSSASKHKTITLKNNTYQGGSIVDSLKEIGFDSSYDNRCIIALKNGIEDYHGTYEQNVYLLKLLKQGKLKA